jgi:hypothetical protein
MLKEFGYLPRSLDVTIGDLNIKTLPCLKATTAAVESHQYRNRDWIEIPAGRRVFSLPKTHEIARTDPKNDQHVEFLVWVLGFLVGMRLTTTEAGFLDATPCTPGKLVDFHCFGRDLERAVGHADDFYVKHYNGSAPGLVVAAVHALFVAHGPHLLCYERLLYLYTALDACWKATQGIKALNDIGHASRIKVLCEIWCMPVPTWAEPVYCSSVRRMVSQLSRLRNDMIHEGLMNGAPLGFRTITSFDDQPHPLNNPLFEVEHLLCRLIVALLGIPAQDYIARAVAGRNIHGLSVAA